MDPTKTTQTPSTPDAKAPDATSTMSIPGVGSVATSTTSTTPGALDFTGGSANGLSMADSLASAQDNLTSAGMAAGNMNNQTLGLDQVGAGDPSATMDRPDEPLIPAAPAPGSIGSVTSGPAVAPETGMASAEAAPASMPYNPFAATTQPATQAPQEQAGMVAAPAAQAPQPTTTMQPDMNQASSTNVPTALQPKTSKFSMSAGRTPMLIWILGAAAAIFAIAMVVFMVLWIQGMNNQKVVYVPNTPVEPEPVVTSATCVMDRPADGSEGMDGLSGIYSTVTLNFSNDSLTNYDVAGRYTFGEAAQAEAARPLFETMAALFAAAGAGSDSSPLSANFNVTDNVVDLNMKTDVTAALESENVTLDLPKDEATGDYLLDATSIKDYLGGQGYVCE